MWHMTLVAKNIQIRECAVAHKQIYAAAAAAQTRLSGLA